MVSQRHTYLPASHGNHLFKYIYISKFHHSEFVAFFTDAAITPYNPNKYPRKFAQSEQNASVANTQSIINSLLLSFP